MPAGARGDGVLRAQKLIAPFESYVLRKPLVRATIVSMRVTASKLRENIYRILDEAIETGNPVEVVRKGTVLKIVPEKRPSKLDRLIKRKNVFVGDPDDIIGMDWSKYWSELR